MLSSGSPSPNLEVTTPTSRTYLEDWPGKRLCEGPSGLGSQGQGLSNIPRRAREWDALFASVSWLLISTCVPSDAPESGRETKL